MKMIDILSSIGIDPANTPEDASLTIREGYACIEQFARDKDGDLVATANGDDFVTEFVEYCLPA